MAGYRGQTGIPAGVPVWYTDAVHGDLANHERAFEAYRELIETGNTRLLPRSSAGARGETVPVFRARGLTGGGLYPSADEVLAAATGGARPGRRTREKGEAPVVIEVIHGSLASAETPVLIGAYAGDTLRGSAKFLNDHLDGRMERAGKIGRYPCQVGSAMVFRQTEPTAKPAGAIVVGLGVLGDLLPGSPDPGPEPGFARICPHHGTAVRGRSVATRNDSQSPPCWSAPVLPACPSNPEHAACWRPCGGPTGPCCNPA